MVRYRKSNNILDQKIHRNQGISPNKGKSKDKSLEITLLESPSVYEYMPRYQEIT